MKFDKTLALPAVLVVIALAVLVLVAVFAEEEKTDELQLDGATSSQY